MLLWRAEKYDDVERYIMHTPDTDLVKWWAQYLESRGQLDQALRFYSKADDYLSQTRIKCYAGNIEAAANLVSETNDKPSAYNIRKKILKDIKNKKKT